MLIIYFNDLFRNVCDISVVDIDKMVNDLHALLTDLFEGKVSAEKHLFHLLKLLFFGGILPNLINFCLDAV